VTLFIYSHIYRYDYCSHLLQCDPTLRFDCCIYTFTHHTHLILLHAFTHTHFTFTFIYYSGPRYLGLLHIVVAYLVGVEPTHYGLPIATFPLPHITCYITLHSHYGPLPVELGPVVITVVRLLGYGPLLITACIIP